MTATLSSQTSLGLPSSQPVQPSVDTGGEEESDLGPVLPAIMTLERMVNQNIFDDVTQGEFVLDCSAMRDIKTGLDRCTLVRGA